MHDLSYESEFNLPVTEIVLSYERMGIKTRFEKEAQGTLNRSTNTKKDDHSLYFSGLKRTF